MMPWNLGSIPFQTGKLAVITGATGGLGLETAIGLAGAGAEVVLAGRDPAKGKAALETLHEHHPTARAHFEKVDLASLNSVADFAGRLLERERPIDILVNNAGVMALRDRTVSADGFEMQLATNYLSHFALTGRLLPLLRAGQARVVELSSIAHRSAKIQLDDLNYETGYKAFAVYGQSKLAMLMFALELDRRSKASGWGVTSVAAHPGIARTDLFSNGPAIGAGSVQRFFTTLMTGILGHSAAAGAMPSLMASTYRMAQGGEYFGPTGWMEFKGPPGPAKIAAVATDTEIARKLWDASELLTGVHYR